MDAAYAQPPSPLCSSTSPAPPPPDITSSWEATILSLITTHLIPASLPSTTTTCTRSVGKYPPFSRVRENGYIFCYRQLPRVLCKNSEVRKSNFIDMQMIPFILKNHVRKWTSFCTRCQCPNQLMFSNFMQIENLVRPSVDQVSFFQGVLKN